MIIKIKITITGVITIAIDAGAIAEIIAIVITVVIIVVIEIGGVITPLEEEKIKISIRIKDLKGILA